MYPVQPILKRRYLSSGAASLVSIPSDAVKVELYNLTNIAAAAGLQYSVGVAGMPAASAYTFTGVAPVVQAQITANGFSFVDTSIQQPGAAIATTAVSAANPAVVLTANTAGLVAGSSVVRMINVTNMQQISSLEFTVGTIVPNVSFQLKYLNSTGFVAGNNGFYRLIPNDPIFYPRRRSIVAMSQAVNMIVTMSVDHGYTVGQKVRLVVPAAFGMVQADGLLGSIVAIGQADASGLTNTITLDIDSSGFTAFAWPLSAVAGAGVSFPEVTPVGEAATNSILQPWGNLLDDATRNLAVRGVRIGSAVAGALNDNMLLLAYSGLSF